MDKITVLDFGCQYTHQLGEGVRKAGVYSEIVPHDVPYDALRGSKGLILSGGPESVYEKGSIRCDRRFFSGEMPVLGICYGHQLMADDLGGTVGNDGSGEYGEGRITILNNSPLFAGLDSEETVWMSHGDSVLKVPEGFEVLAYSGNGIIAAMGDESRRLYGLQFHPEVSNTPRGKKIIQNFALNICGAKPEWKADNYLERAIAEVRRQVGDGHAYVFVSGGVDSSVAAVIAYKALGNRVTAYHVDNGFERKGEAEHVKEMLENAGIHVEVLNTQDITLGRIGRTLLPERKRLIVGDAFVDALYQQIPGFEGNKKAFLVQGTIYPDSIESGEGVGRSSALIKSHHNVASALIKKLKANGRVVEPNIRFFKYEVREFAEQIGLSIEISRRHPFPGPGFAVRYVGRVMKPDDDTQHAASAILDEYGLRGVVVPVGTVGVKGSHRAYGSLVLIEGEREQYEMIRQVSNRLGNEVPGITRAALILAGKYHSQEEWNDVRRMHITSERLGILREADDIAMRNLVSHGMYDKISQMPVTLFPGPERIPWVGIRPVVTPDFMTGRPPYIPEEMTWEYLDTTSQEIMGKTPVGGVVLDTSSKPPATVEWE